MATRLELINDALALLGEQSLEFESAAAAAAFGDAGVVDPEDDLQRIAAAAYPVVRASMLNAHPWSWLTERTILVESPFVEGEPEPQSSWPHTRRYRLPNPDIGSIRAVFSSATPSTPQSDGWTVQGGWLFTDFALGRIESQRVVAEEVFPQLFQNAMVMGLCAEMAMPVKEDLDTMRMYARKAEAALNDAMRVDAQSHPVATIPRFAWEEARLTGLTGTRSHAVT